MLTALIIFGLLFAGGIVAAGWLHWRGVVRFGKREPSWGIGTMLIGLIQVIVWSVFPGGPDLWLRLVTAVVGALLVGLWLIWRQATAGSAPPPSGD